MPLEPTISSHQNPRVREVCRLRESRQRRKSGLFLVDGEKEILEAARAGLQFQAIYCTTEGAGSADGLADLRKYNVDFEHVVTLVTQDVLERLSYGQHTARPVAVAQTPELSLEQLSLNSTSRLLVLDRTEKPGNVGACLRTAAACGVDAVVLTDPICELHNPNTIRASRGAIFRIPVAEATSGELIQRCGELSIPISAARVDGQASVWDCELGSGFAIVFGNEADGLGRDWDRAGVGSFVIPMQHDTDSLNLSISCAVTLYESVRQRRC